MLPRLWSDLVVFDQASREQSLAAMLAALQHSVTTDENLLAKHADVAWAIYTRVEAQQDDDDSRDRFRAKIRSVPHLRCFSKPVPVPANKLQNIYGFYMM